MASAGNPCHDLVWVVCSTYGRVPEPCGYFGWTGLELPARLQPDGTELSHWVPKAWCRPFTLSVGTPGPLTLMMGMLANPTTALAAVAMVIRGSVTSHAASTPDRSVPPPS